MASARSHLTAEGLDALLRVLDADRERAGAAYELLRRKFVRMFEARGCTQAEDLADDTLDRAGRKLAGGQVVHGEIGGFLHGIAINVLREWWRRPRTEGLLAELRSPVRPDADAPHDRLETAFYDCYDALPDAERELVDWYYQFGEKVLIGARRDLAARLGIGMNALRIRTHRLRARLEDCVRGRLRAGEIESPLRTRPPEDDTE